MDLRLDIPSLLDVYTRPYDKKMLEWRRLGAVDKVSNIVDILGPRSSSLNSVLEVGAGTGQVLEMLAHKRVGNQHTGIEIGDARARPLYSGSYPHDLK
jgi:SAM-dependent methyltransferase